MFTLRDKENSGQCTVLRNNRLYNKIGIYALRNENTTKPGPTASSR